jgi:hypothetical protein
MPVLLSTRDVSDLTRHADPDARVVRRIDPEG